MAIAWVLRHPAITSALVGASRVSQIGQIEDSMAALQMREFTAEELQRIELILAN